MADPNQQFYGGQPGYPPNQGYPGGYPQGPPQAGYPPGYPPQGGYPPQSGYPPQGGYPPQASGYPAGDGYPQAGYQPGGYQPQGGYGAYDPEAASDDVKGFAFNDQSIRKAFIRKVYSILTIQLLITCGAISLFVLHEGTKMFVQRRPYLVWIALGVAFVLTIAISCCENVRRQTPMNFILLGLFTLAESFMLGAISARYERLEVLMAIGITAAVCLTITIFALQTKWDFTVCGGVLLVALVIFVVFGIIAIFIPGKVVSIVYSALGALLFSFYLLYDTQLMMGGKHKYALSPEDYIFAALSLYLDVINIFIYILSLIASSRD